ncbi:MAG: hypothetical protein ACRCXB_35045 [Aeromonadaceae bacterium]
MGAVRNGRDAAHPSRFTRGRQGWSLPQVEVARQWLLVAAIARGRSGPGAAVCGLWLARRPAAIKPGARIGI